MKTKSNKSAKSGKNDCLDSVVAVRRALGCALNTCREWIRLPDFPKRGKAGWNRLEVLRWAEARVKARAQKLAAAAGDGDMKALKLARQCALLGEQVRDRRLCADRVEMELKIQSDEYVDARAIHAWATPALAAFNDAWRAAESALDARLTDRRAFEECCKIFDSARNVCAQSFKKPIRKVVDA